MESLRLDDSAVQTLSITLQLRPTGDCSELLPVMHYQSRSDTVNLVGNISEYSGGPLGRVVVMVTFANSGQTNTAWVENHWVCACVWLG